jgi:hypothetical protein
MTIIMQVSQENKNGVLFICIDSTTGCFALATGCPDPSTYLKNKFVQLNSCIYICSQIAA